MSKALVSPSTAAPRPRRLLRRRPRPRSSRGLCPRTGEATLQAITKQAMQASFKCAAGNLNWRRKELNNKWKSSNTRGGSLADMAIWSLHLANHVRQLGPLFLGDGAQRLCGQRLPLRARDSPANPANISSSAARARALKPGETWSAHLSPSLARQVPENEVLSFPQVLRALHASSDY